MGCIGQEVIDIFRINLIKADIFFLCHIAVLHSIKLRASIILALVKLALMSGETLTRKFLVKSQEKLAHNFLTYGLRYTLYYCPNLKADWGLSQQKMLKRYNILWL